MARRGRPPYPDVLTPREWEVLALLREGRSNEEIAERLGISLAGAKYHVSEILGKLGVESREEAARWQPRARPWWAAALAPFGLLWRAMRSSWLAGGVATGAALLVAAGGGLLVWGLVRTSGGAHLVGPTACPGGPTVPSSTTPLLGYVASDRTIWVVDADGRRATKLVCGPTGSGMWSPSGRYLAYQGDGFSLRILDTKTGAASVADDGTDGLPLLGQWSPDDTLIYQKEKARDAVFALWTVKPGATPIRILTSSNVIQSYFMSPDGRRILYQEDAPPKTINGRAGQLVLTNTDGSNVHKLTDGVLYGINPWSPDGRLIAYFKDQDADGVGNVYVMDIDAEREFPLGQFTSAEHPGWSPDGSRDVFHNLAIDPLSLSATPLFDRPTAIINWAPDGTKVAYIDGPLSDGVSRSLVILDTTTGQKIPVRSSSVFAGKLLAGGLEGTWSPDSRYYAYLVPESIGNTISSALYVLDLESGAQNRVMEAVDSYQVSIAYSPDGSRLLVQEGFALSSSVWVADADGSGLTKLADGLALMSSGSSPAWRPRAQ